MKFDDKIDITSTDDVYSKIKAELNRLDPPRIIEESLETMIHNKADKSCRYISKRSIGSLTMEDFYEVKEEQRRAARWLGALAPMELAS